MAVIENYTDVVSLQEVRTYLRFDVTDADVNAEITRMINSACKLIEDYTNYRLKPQLIYYFFENGKIRIYDFPIIDIQTPVDSDDYKRVDKGLYIELTDLRGMEASNLPVIANAGYNDTDAVNPILVQAVLETIRVWFFNSEQDSVKGVLSYTAMNKGVLPYTAMNMVSGLKRFFL